jgi:hypothetical protein
MNLNVNAFIVFLLKTPLYTIIKLRLLPFTIHSLRIKLPYTDKVPSFVSLAYVHPGMHIHYLCIHAYVCIALSKS